MFRSHCFLSWVAAFGLAVTLSGCDTPTAQEKQKPSAPADSKAQEQPAGQSEHPAGHEGHEHPAKSGEHGDHADHNAHADASPADALKGLAELSADDRAAAEKQRVCPVSGDALGSNGKPLKVTAKGKTVYLCCPDCKEPFEKDPDKYLAKLKDAQHE
jgi:YHS domain-containing protein